MDVKSNKKSASRPIGYASKLKRYGASLANHKNYSRRDFILTLAHSHQTLRIEKRSEELERPFDDNGDEIDEPVTQIEFRALECPKCLRKSDNTQSLLQHLVSQHGRPDDKLWYENFQTVGKELESVFKLAVTKQFENSHVKRKFNNSNDFLLCPTDSPLFPFITMRHLQIYFQEMPLSVADGISLKLQNDDTPTTIIFSFQKIDKVRKRIKKAMAKKTSEAESQELERKCEKDYLGCDDVCENTSRDSEEFQMLAQAFNLPPTCSHDDIMEKINEIRAKHDEINPFCSNVYTNNVKPNGQMMSKEEKRLISSLTNDMVKPVSGKRKTTYKNPSEFVPVKKRQKTSSPV